MGIKCWIGGVEGGVQHFSIKSERNRKEKKEYQEEESFFKRKEIKGREKEEQRFKNKKERKKYDLQLKKMSFISGPVTKALPSPHLLA